MALSLAVAVGVWSVIHGVAQHPTDPHRHPEGQALTNPVNATSESIARGRTRYVFACRQCHGNRGRGDGDMAHAGGVPSDFTDDVWQHGDSDGEIFLVIREGVSADMQPYRDQIPDEDIWHLVNYLKSLAE
jgi:mono/diheme cytochrome c family protein